MLLTVKIFLLRKYEKRITRIEYRNRKLQKRKNMYFVLHLILKLNGA